MDSMGTPDYTLVVGVDAKHLRQLAQVWPTWIKHKPSLLDHPMIAFYDESVKEEELAEVLKESNDRKKLATIGWPWQYVDYDGDGLSKWENPQREKMLSGFVYVSSACVKTPYWLKLDTDVVATGMDDWIDPEWFKWYQGDPAIVAQPWGYTKPADQMLKLDEWVKRSGNDLHELNSFPPLKLVPNPGSEQVCHKRIISWCGFFSTDLSKVCVDYAMRTVGPCRLPVPSQDGFMWYVAERMGLPIIRSQMKSRGWEHWTTFENIEKAVERSLHGIKVAP
jgi:hypothetical protein